MSREVVVQFRVVSGTQVKVMPKLAATPALLGNP